MWCHIPDVIIILSNLSSIEASKMRNFFFSKLEMSVKVSLWGKERDVFVTRVSFLLTSHPTPSSSWGEKDACLPERNLVQSNTKLLHRTFSLRKKKTLSDLSCLTCTIWLLILYWYVFRTLPVLAFEPKFKSSEQLWLESQSSKLKNQQ
jgi:hypothetical protein